MPSLLERQIVNAGKREDLANLIAMVDAKDTPFTSMAKKGAQPGNTIFRWQADRLPATTAPTPVVDGTDVDPATGTTNFVNDGTTQFRVELSNRIQIFRKAVRVSKLTQDVANIAGVRDELANNVSKAITLIKRDMEVAMCGNQGAQVDNGTVGYRTRGLDKWIVAAANIDTVDLPAAASAFCPSASQISTVGTAALTETVVQDILTGIYSQTGQFKDYDALVGPTLKRAFTNLVFTTNASGTNQYQSIRTFNREADASSYVSSVDVFEGDFGRIRLHPSLFLKNNFSGYIIPFDMVEVRYGGNVAQVTELTDNGGGPARLVEAVAGLCIHNPLAFGKFDFTA
ncbi:Family of unknown function (DUF5309) [uncultured Caudovirales phage]|uniref:Major capsid protein n=1 Tax=uncultured Caudovirales phage TaxID=2100421 RepID=A0A6J5M355_9CAUD|nr:Family of unknown function (DUF5309) [uncultured Caudovirales phage]